MATNEPCRCGHKAGDGDHPCHARNYSCRQPAKQRLYNPRPVALTGMSMKLEMAETWACDACWASFSHLIKETSDGKAE